LSENRIARGVQWELVRGCTQNEWTVADIRAKIGLLQGTNAEIHHKVFSIMTGKPLNKHSDNSIGWVQISSKGLQED
jgi:hypothetical protein